MKAKPFRVVWASLALVTVLHARAGAATLEISYGVNLGGAQIMAADFGATLSKTLYSGTFKAKTTGVSKLFSKTRYVLTTQGKAKTGQLLPLVSQYERQKNGKTRTRKLVFDGTMIVTEGQDFPASALPALDSPVADPISAVFAMTVTDNPCNYRTRVFDGRDVYDISTRPKGGSAARPVCALTYKPIAGDDVDNGDTASQSYDITFATAAGAFTFVPINLTGSSKGVPFDVTATAVTIDGAALAF
jgi:Protein of unknown function (DUF3108)